MFIRSFVIALSFATVTPASASLAQKCSAALSIVRTSAETLAGFVPGRQRKVIRGHLGRDGQKKLERFLGQTARVRVFNRTQTLGDPGWRTALAGFFENKRTPTFRGRLVEIVPDLDSDEPTYSLRFEVPGSADVTVRPSFFVSSGGFFGRGFQRHFTVVELVF